MSIAALVVTPLAVAPVLAHDRKVSVELGASAEYCPWDYLRASVVRHMSPTEFLHAARKLVHPQADWNVLFPEIEDGLLVAPGTVLNPVQVKSPQKPRDQRGYWRPASAMPRAPRHRPLEGVVIAIDPGHLGGRWAQLEGRFFEGPCGTVVAEGDMTLRVAKLLGEKLEYLGAQVFLTRTNDNPINGEDPGIFRSRALAELKARHASINPASLARTQTRILLQTAEIESRAKIINEVIRPDLVLCLHFNAEPWGHPSRPQFSEKNHFHILIGGAYTQDELQDEEQKMHFLRRVWEGTVEEEKRLASAISWSMVSRTGLQPFSYGEDSKIATRPTYNPYIWQRNLLATRIFHAPVIYLEPFVMNNLEVVKMVQDADRPWQVASGQYNIFENYAKGVAQGVVRHYLKHRPLRE